MAGRSSGGSNGPVRRRPSPQIRDLDLWHAAMRDVRPLRDRPRRPDPGDATPAPASRDPEPAAAVAPPRHDAAPAVSKGPIELPAIRGHRAPGLDKSSAERLKRGRYKIDARLDLHGMTQDEAHRALVGFIASAARDGHRCVLVITGKGLSNLSESDTWRIRPDDLGILRNAVPRWLNEPPT